MNIFRSEELSGRVAMPPIMWSHRSSFIEAGDDEDGDGEEYVDKDKDGEKESGAL